MTVATHARLTELFTEAIALTPERRQQLIDELRSSDRALADELVELLDADARSATALDHGGLAASVLRTAPIPESLAIPGYRIQRVLGEGAMGRVYEAEQQAPRRPVAIKVLHARSPSALARFTTEAEIMARLDHPGIARVLEAGEASGFPFVALEYIEGETLDVYAGSRSRAERIDLVIALCDAVHHAHLHGVIHRDLKPKNVMVRPGGRIAVLDFGVARLAATDSANGETRAGDLLGTPLYMSPEQASLRSDQVDARSDVYTIGVMLYELLCGTLPYPLDGLALPAIARTICERPPARPSDVPRDLEAILLHALAKRPEERYQSAAALADDLRRFRDARSVSVRVPGVREQLQRFVKRRPLVALAIAGGIVASVAVAVAVTLLWRTAERGTNQVTLRQARAALESDPTSALALLAAVGERDVDPVVAWTIADEAIGRGVAHDVWHAHDHEVRWIEGLPGGDGFVTGAYDGKVAIWDGGDAPLRTLFHAAHGRIQVVRPSPDGAMIAIGGDDGLLRVVARDGTVLAELAGHPGKVERLAWSRGGDLVSGDDKGVVWVWPHARAPGVQIAASSAVIGCVAFADDSSAVATGDYQGTVRLWQRAGGAVLAERIGADVIDAWTDGAQVVAVDAAGTVHTLHVDHGALVRDRSVATGNATKRAVFAADGSWVVLGGVGGVATRVAGTAIEQLATHRAQVRYLAISADGARVATASDDGVLQVIDRLTGRHWNLLGHHGRIRHVAWAGGALLSSDGEGVVRRWDIAAMPPTVLDGHVAAERLAGDPATLVTVDGTGDVARWDLATGGRTPLGHTDGHITAIANAHGIAITGTTEGSVQWWDKSHSELRLPSGVRAIAIGRAQVAIATAAGPITLCSLQGEGITTLDGNPGGTEAIAYDPTGSLLASGGKGRKIRVWRIADPPVAVATLDGRTGDTHFLTFTPAGDRLIAAGNDGAVFAWTVHAGVVDPASRRLLTRHTGAVSALAVSPDGRYLASAGRDTTVVRVELATGASDAIPIGAAVATLAFDDRGAIRAITRNGTLAAQVGDRAAIAMDHGVHAGVALPGHRLAVARDDGAIVVLPLAERSFAELGPAIARATTYVAGVP